MIYATSQRKHILNQTLFIQEYLIIIILFESITKYQNIKLMQISYLPNMQKGQLYYIWVYNSSGPIEKHANTR